MKLRNRDWQPAVPVKGIPYSIRRNKRNPQRILVFEKGYDDLDDVTGLLTLGRYSWDDATWTPLDGSYTGKPQTVRFYTYSAPRGKTQFFYGIVCTLITSDMYQQLHSGAI